MKGDLAEGILSKLKVPDRRSISEWAEENLILPESKRSRTFREDTAPWLVPVLDSIKENTFTSLLKTTQGGGTVVEQGALTYWVAESPADTAFMAQTDTDAQVLFKTKFLPTLKASPATAALLARLPRHAIKKDEVSLPSMRIGIHGPGEKSTQSLSLERVLVDEVWLLRLTSKAALRNMIERGTASPATFRLVCVSQAGEEMADKKGNPLPAEWQEHWEGGTQEIWSFRCPACGEVFAPETKHFRAPENARDSGGRWIWARVATGTRLITPCCGHEIKDNETNRRALATSGTYIPTNPNPLPNHRSFHFGCWTVYWQTWGTNLIQFLKAVAAKRRGDIQPLKEWTTKKEARFWTLKDQEPPPFARKSYGYKLADLADGSLPEGLQERLLTADMQTNRFEWVIRDWFPGGSSRLVATGACASWGDLAQVAGKYRLRDYRVAVDMGDWTQEVWRECAKRKWIAIRGTGGDLWTHRTKKETSKQPWSPPQKGRITTARRGVRQPGGRPADAAHTHCYYYEISDLYFEDWLSRLISGDGVAWEYGDDSPEEYIKSLDSVQKVQGPTGRMKYDVIGNRQNHRRDAEKYSLALAAIIGGVFVEVPAAEEAPKE